MTAARDASLPPAQAPLAPQGVAPEPLSTQRTSPLPLPASASAQDTRQKADPETGFFPLFRNASFLKLWTGQVFSQIADKFYLVLMIVFISSRFQAPGQSVSGWVSAVMIAFTIPAVLFGSVAGVYVDRWPKRPLLVLTNVLRGGLVLGLLPLLMVWAQQGGWLGLPLGFWVLLVITFLVSATTQFFAPAEQATIPLIVPTHQLMSANALYTLTMLIALIAGFAMGDPLLLAANAIGANWGGPPDLGGILLVSGSYGVAALLLLWVAIQDDSAPRSQAHPHLWADLRVGYEYLQQNRAIRGALIQLVLLFSVFAALVVLVVRLAEVLPTLHASQFGFLLAAGGVGMACTAALLGQLGHQFKRRYLSFGGTMGMALLLAALAFATQSLWATFAIILGLGVCGALVGIPMQTTLQTETPEEMRGKVFGLQNNAVNIALSLPLALAGLAETLWGLQTVLLGLAGLVVLGGLLSWFVVNSQAKRSKSMHLENGQP